MKLNPDIIYENLKCDFPCEIKGYRTSDLTIRRPEFFLSETKELKSGHLYVLTGNPLPRRLPVEKGCLIVSCGNCTDTSFYPFEDSCAIIRLTEDENPYAVVNALYGIFEKYSNWDHKLADLLESSSNLEKMSEYTADLFDNPILVLDSDLRYVVDTGHTKEEDRDYWKDNPYDDQLSIDALNQFLENMEMRTMNRGPMYMDIAGHAVCSINLFDLDSYCGSVTLQYRRNPQRCGDDALLEHFSKYLLLAMKKHTSFITSDRNTYRSILTSLVHETRVEEEAKQKLSKMNVPPFGLCIVIKPSERISKIPVNYFCEQLESKMGDCIAFSYRDFIVCFLALENQSMESGVREDLEQKINEITENMVIKIGMSSCCDNIFEARLCYLQAVAALNNGCILHPDNKFYYFQNYALIELIINAQNDLPLEMYYSDSLYRLFEHDKTSNVSYIDTLRVYLNSNMNITDTANKLYIHRSTLIERLSHIKEKLSEDLDDPDTRLLLQIILKALELRDTLSNV